MPCATNGLNGRTMRLFMTLHCFSGLCDPRGAGRTKSRPASGRLALLLPISGSDRTHLALWLY
jgi:hypothetical protein